MLGISKNSIHYYFSMIIIVLAVALIGYFYCLQFYPFEIVELHEFRVLEQQVQPGDTIQLLMDFDKKYDYKADIQFSMVDGFTYAIPAANIHQPLGDKSSIKLIKIPEYASGTYHIEVALSYQTTPFRQINYVWKSNEFIVK